MSSPAREKAFRKQAKSLSSVLEEQPSVSTARQTERAPGQDAASFAVGSLQEHLGNRHLLDALHGTGGSGLHEMSAQALDLALAGVDDRETNPSTAPISAMRRRLEADRAAGGPNLADDEVLAGIGRWKGNPLPAPLMARLEAAFGRNFEGVRIHTDDEAALSAEALNAQAFTLGSHIYFGTGKFNPDSPEGLELLAHELTHVTQEQDGRLPPASGEGITVSQPTDPSELEAESTARDVAQALPAATPMDAEHAETPAPRPIVRPAEQSGPGLEQSAESDTVGQEPVDEDSRAMADTDLVAGTYVKIELTLKIPTPIAGLTVDVTVSGKYTESSKGAQKFIEAEGTVRIAITYKLLFLSLSLFLQGNLKLKVKTDNAKDALNRGFTDISHWFAAKELANLPKKKGQVVDGYTAFENEIYTIFGGLLGKSDEDRNDELNHFGDGWFFDNSLQNVADARNDLVGKIQGIFEDMDGTISGDDVYPGTDWIQQQVAAMVKDNKVTYDECVDYMMILLNKSREKRESVSKEMDNIPAIQNDPGVEFEGNLQVGFKAGIELSKNTKASIEMGKGWRIADSMDATTFDTQVKDVYFCTLSADSNNGEIKFSGELSYEGVGSKITEPDSFKVAGKILVGVSSEQINEAEEPGTLKSITDRLKTAFSGASGAGQDVLAAMSTAVKRELTSWKSSLKEPKAPTLNSEMMAGLDFELPFEKKPGGGYGLKGGDSFVRFVTVQKISGSIGIGEGSIESGSYIGVGF